MRTLIITFEDKALNLDTMTMTCMGLYGVRIVYSGHYNTIMTKQGAAKKVYDQIREGLLRGDKTLALDPEDVWKITGCGVPENEKGV